MKSKLKVYKDIGINLLNFIISTIISICILIYIYKKLNLAYIYTSSPNYIYKLVTAFMAIKNNVFGDFIYVIILFIFISIIYTILSYKRYKNNYDNINLLVSNVEEMANRNLDRKIDIKLKDEIGLRYYIDIAYKKYQSLNLLINDLFELTKLRNKSLFINKTSINLVELVNQVISYLNYQVN